MHTITTTTANSDIISILENYIKNFFHKDKGEHMIYVAREFDHRNGTKFDRLSNNLEIGVIARNTRVANILLRLVRIVVDDNDYLFRHPFEGFDDEKDTLLIEDYIDRFKEPDTFTQSLEKVSNIDIWTPPRIFSSIRAMIN